MKPVKALLERIEALEKLDEPEGQMEEFAASWMQQFYQMERIEEGFTNG